MRPRPIVTVRHDICTIAALARALGVSEREVRRELIFRGRLALPDGRVAVLRDRALEIVFDRVAP